jgi:hypothetical protein
MRSVHFVNQLWGLSFSCLISCLPLSAPAAVISSCDESGLRSALASGGAFTFSCDGTIALSGTLVVSNNVVLDATGHRIVISGNGAVRIFKVNSGAHLSLINVVLANGKYAGTNGFDGSPAASGESAKGGAILVTNASVDLSACILSNNVVVGGSGGSNPSLSTVGAGSGGTGEGGAVYGLNSILNVTNCLFANNQASGAPGGSSAKDTSFAPTGDSFGGAVCIFGGTMFLTNTVFNSNTSTGTVAGANIFGIYGSAGNASGGGIHNHNGGLTLSGCTFQNNIAVGGYVPFNGGLIGKGRGGAVSVNSNATLNCLTSSFMANQALGGHASRFAGPGQGLGGALYNEGSVLFSETTFEDNFASTGFSGNTGGDAKGGAIYNSATCALGGCLLLQNACLGGTSFGIGGPGAPGAGGNALGGGVYNSGSISLTNTTLYRNKAQGAHGTGTFSIGSGGRGGGGALFSEGIVTTLQNVTIFENTVLGGKGSPKGSEQGAGIYSTNGTVTLQNTILANSLNGSNCFGTLIDGGYNLSSDGSCNFTNTGSMNNTDPLLGPSQNNGGATLTLGLTDCSPALDAGNPTIFPLADQRGFSRPQGIRSDIGAVEGIVTWYHTVFSFSNQNVQMQIFGKPNQAFILSTSSDLFQWTPVLTNNLGANCLFNYSTARQPFAFFKIVYQ